jgi:flagellar motor switch protein FliG
MPGLQKAAVLMIALGPELAAQVLKKGGFHEEDIERLTYAVSNMERVKVEVRDQVLEEFEELRLAKRYLLQGGIKYAREMLEKTVGPQKAQEIIRRLVSAAKILPFASLRRTEPRHLLPILQDEHPQTLALVLAYLEPEQAAAILASLPPELRIEVVRRLAKMEPVAPETAQEVEKVLERRLAMYSKEKEALRVGGVASVVAVLNAASRAVEKSVLEALDAEDPMLAEEIRRRMFVFEDLVKLDDVSIQRVLREVQGKDLALALKAASEDVRDRIFRNLSSRAAQMLKEELEYMGPVRLRDVEEAQQRVVRMVRRLEDAGEIVIARGGEDAILV